MKIFSSVSLFIIALLFISCEKKSDPAPATPTKTNLLTASTWKLNAAGVDQDKNGTIDFSVMALLQPCTIDNTLTFKTDNTGITDEGASKCNAADPQSTNFNWSFADSEASINVSNSVLGQLNGKSKILELSETSLSLTKDTVIGGVTVGAIVQLKH